MSEQEAICPTCHRIIEAYRVQGVGNELTSDDIAQRILEVALDCMYDVSLYFSWPHARFPITKELEKDLEGITSAIEALHLQMRMERVRREGLFPEKKGKEKP